MRHGTTITNHLHGPITPAELEHRSNPRRPCRATVWAIDAAFERVTEIGHVEDLSRDGLRIRLDQSMEESLHLGSEMLILLDDPEELDPEASDRPAIVTVRRIRHDADSSEFTVGAQFVAKRPGYCVRQRPRRADARRPHDFSDVLSGDALDELVERVGREILATDRATDPES